MKHSQTLEDALYRWAAEERGGLDIGYPKACPTTRNYVAGYRHSAPTPTVFEIDILKLVTRGISDIKSKQDWDWTLAYMCLEAYYGAHPSLSDDRQERIKWYRDKLQVSRTKFYEALDRGRDYLQSRVDIYTADMS